MNILFLTTGRMDSIEQHAIYPDLLRCFRDNGHNVYTVSSYERRTGKETELIEDHGAHMLHVKIGNLTKTSTIEKGISTVLIEKQYKNAIKKYFIDVKFDLVVYSTPPITLVKVIEYIKKRDNCKSYLLLKDIFPQNAIDLGMLKKAGIKGFLYKFFRNEEKKLYRLSDYIGCMSQANVEYVIKNNSEVNPNTVEICPNCVEVMDKSVSPSQRNEIREKYGIPVDKKVFVYGGNLGKPQGINFVIDCLREVEKRNDAYFLIVGEGTEYKKIENYVMESRPQNIQLMRSLPKDEYDSMVGACDVGLIFLDHRFTIPNFPSRLLAYTQACIPILAATDVNTDIGQVIVDGGFGWWCESNNVSAFIEKVNEALLCDTEELGRHGFEYLRKNFTAQKAADIIMRSITERG